MKAKMYKNDATVEGILVDMTPGIWHQQIRCTCKITIYMIYNKRDKIMRLFVYRYRQYRASIS